MKELRKRESGFSLIELIMVIALTGIIAGAITMTIFQLFNMNTRTANRMAAISQVQHAGKVVSEDILEAQTVTPGATSGFPLTLNWTDVASNKHGIVYKLEGIVSQTQTLWRSYYFNSVLNSTTKVAEYIDPRATSIAPATSCSVPSCGAFTFTVTATVGNESETRPYEVKPRPGS